MITAKDIIDSYHNAKIKHNQPRFYFDSMTKEQYIHRVLCGMNIYDQFSRMSEWAEMLESRLMKLDKDYRSYQYGLTPSPASSPNPVSKEAEEHQPSNQQLGA